MADILGQIANPQIADIAGALDYREKKMQADEARRKEIRTNQLAGQALSSGLKEGTPLHDLALENPTAYLGVSKAMGIDPADGDGMHQMTVDVHVASNLAKNDPQAAINYMMQEKERRSKLGLPTAYLDKGLEHAQDNLPEFVRSLNVMDQTWNPPAAKEGFTLGNARYDSTGKMVAQNIDPLEQEKLDLERQKLANEKAKAAGGNLDAKEIQQIQKDVSNLLQPTQDTYKAAASMANLKDRGTPLAMQAAIIQFNKALDPGSVVRTEEGKVVSSSGGALGGLIAKYNDAVGKGKLSNEVFNDIVETAKSLSDSAVESSQQQMNDYLSPYGSTLSDDFKKNISSRVPKKFNNAAPKNTETTTPAATGLTQESAAQRLARLMNNAN